jgi:hypothetical protein
MPGVPRKLAEHSLHVWPDAKPIKQPLRHFVEEKRKAIGADIARLLVAGFIMKVFYPDWLANPVLVPKKTILGACVLTTLASTRLAPRIPSRYHASTR